MNTNTQAPQTLRDDASALLAMLNRLEALQRPARHPQRRLDDAEVGDLLVLIDASATPATRRLVEVTSLDGAIVVENERFHRGHGFAERSIEAGNLARFVQPADDWSWPGLLAFLGLEL